MRKRQAAGLLSTHPIFKIKEVRVVFPFIRLRVRDELAGVSEKRKPVHLINVSQLSLRKNCMKKKWQSLTHLSLLQSPKRKLLILKIVDKNQYTNCLKDLKKSDHS